MSPNPLRHIAAFVMLLVGIAVTAHAQDLVITGVIDGPLPGGSPKVIELFAPEAVADLAACAIGVANNGGGSDGEEFFLSGSAQAGDFIYVSSEAVQFQQWFGFGPSFTASAVNLNGDDAVEVFCNGVLLDSFGDANVDGNGEVWEYTDGWAYRRNDTAADGLMFNPGNWTYSGKNALDGDTTNVVSATPFPFGSYLPPMPDSTHVTDGHFERVLIESALPELRLRSTQSGAAQASRIAFESADNGTAMHWTHDATFGSDSAARLHLVGADTSGAPLVTFEQSGQVGIGTATPENALDVNGVIRSVEVLVESNWADYVFADGYVLPSLDEVRQHIAEYGHLPGIPSADEVQTNGLAVSKMQTLQMEKIEELVLYILAKDEQVKALEARLQRLEQLLVEQDK
ncbi:MAG: hypothetical protein AAF730_07465 [Bacteroidota bacterium]